MHCISARKVSIKIKCTSCTIPILPVTALLDDEDDSRQAMGLYLPIPCVLRPRFGGPPSHCTLSFEVLDAWTGVSFPSAPDAFAPQMAFTSAFDPAYDPSHLSIGTCIAP